MPGLRVWPPFARDNMHAKAPPTLTPPHKGEGDEVGAH